MGARNRTLAMRDRCLVSGATTAPQDIAIDPSRAGAVVPARIGDRLHVGLPANGTTGYRWVVAARPRFLRVTDDHEEAAPHAPGIVGAPGRQRLDLAVIGEGHGVLRLFYRQPWRGGAATDRAFAVTVAARR